VDVTDGQKGVALLNQGIPGHSLVGNVLTASLMKCSKLTSYPEHGGYTSASKSDTGFEIGMLHRFEQALIPHQGTWQAAGVYHEAMAFNAPLLVRKSTPHAGSLPASGSFLAVEPDNLVLHAMVVEADHLVLRFAEAAGLPVEKGEISSRWDLAAVDETDLLGRTAPERITADGKAFRFSARPFEIKTFRLALA
jgi:alpha-mannosidase